jgi:hypothetical protein
METTLCKNVIQVSEGNDENRYPVPNPNKINISNTKEPSHAHKNTPREEIL